MNGRSGGPIEAGTNVLVFAAADRRGIHGCDVGEEGESGRSTVSIVYGRRGTAERPADGHEGASGSFTGYVTVDPNAVDPDAEHGARTASSRPSCRTHGTSRGCGSRSACT